MLAVMSSVRKDDPSHEYKVFDMMDMVGYSKWLFRAFDRGYEIYREEPDGQVIYLSGKDQPMYFQVAFREGTTLADYTKGSDYLEV